MATIVKIKKDREWNEYQVQFFINGKLAAPQTYHTDDPSDAVGTMISEVETRSKKGESIRISDTDKPTDNLLKTYYPSYRRQLGRL